MGTAVFAVRLVLVIVFAMAGVGKLLDLPGSRQAMRDFGVPGLMSDLTGILLPLAELGVAVALVLHPSARWGGAVALALLLAFVAGISNALRHGVAPDCHCFGQIQSAPAGRETLIRNGILAALAVFVVVEGPGPAVDTWVNARSAAELVAVGLGVFAFISSGLAVQLWLDLRRMAQDLHAAQRMAAGAPPGLPVGVAAPAFDLPSLTGETITLDRLRERELPVLLMFASPGCSSCVELFPNVHRWQQTLRDRLTIAIISGGTIKDNLSLAEQYGLENVLVADDNRMIEAYRIRGTPAAILVSVDGKIASVPGESAFGIEPMIRLVLRDGGLVAAPEGAVA